MGIKMKESNSFENEESGFDDYENQLFPTVYDEKPKKTNVRWIILMLSFFGVMCSYITRLNLSLTIVAMVKPLDHNSTINQTSDKQDIDAANVGRFDWDAKTQGLILGSFFYTYGLLQVFGARYSEQFGGKLVALIIIFSSGLISFLIPTTARLGVIPMMISRALLGVAQSSIYPVYYCMINKWFPEAEQSKSLALLSNGAFLGTIITMYLAGYLSESEYFGGWPSVFYFSGTVCLIWCVFWVCFSASEPRLHPGVNKQEMIYIERDKVGMSLKHQKQTPWMEIYTSKAVWAVIIAKFGVDYVFWLIMLNLPTYLNNVLHFKIHQNGLINCGLNIVLIFSNTLGGFLSDHFVAMKIMNKTKLRKSFQAFACIGTNICLILVTIFQEQSPHVVVLIFLISMVFYGFNTGGDIPIVIDMTEDFPATIFAIANSICSGCGFLAPYLTGYIIDNNVSGYDTWAKVFMLAAFINSCGLIVFLLNASAEPLFKECSKKSQQFDLDPMNSGEREDSCLLVAKKQKLFENNNNNSFAGINPAFQDDE